jgi:hypothetical protein
MGNLARAAMAGLMAATVTAGSAAAQTTQPRLVVHLRTVGINGDVVVVAEGRVTRTFDAVGVSVSWKNDERTRTDSRDVMNIAVRSLSVVELDPFVARSGISRNALGLAVPQAHQVYLFASRIEDVARASHLPSPVILARVLAHELGHVLLGASHSDTGIMSAGVSRAPIEPTFTQAEGLSIRDSLTSGRMLDVVSDERLRHRTLEAD